MDKQSKQYLESLFKVVEQTTDSVCITDKHGTVEYVNPAFEKITGYNREEALGKNPRLLKSGKQTASYYRKLWRTIQSGHYFSDRIINKRKDGALIHEMKTVSPIHNSDGEISHFLSVDRDLTEQVALERGVLTVAEETRRRIGLDIHDNLGQSLTGISYLSRALARDLENRGAAEASRAYQISQLANEAVGRSRSLSKEYYPVVLETAGIESALKELAAYMETVFGVKCDTRTVMKVPLSDDSTKIHLYRIAQEACLNAVKHGSASKIGLDLEVDENRISLRIRDDGSGLESGQLKPGGLGLLSMQYRSNMLNGRITVEKNQLNGADIICLAPNN